MICVWKNCFADKTVDFATCVDMQGRRYNIELDNIRGVEDDFESYCRTQLNKYSYNFKDDREGPVIPTKVKRLIMKRTNKASNKVKPLLADGLTIDNLHRVSIGTDSLLLF